MDPHDNEYKGSIKKQNKEVSGWLPDHNTAYCESVTDFMKYLIGRTNQQTPYPPSPTLVEISKLTQEPPSTILDDTQIFLHLETEPTPTNPPDFKIPPRQKPSWSQHKQLFLRELASLGILSATLDWKRSPESPWNSIVLACVAKHYDFANSRGAFSIYPKNMAHTSKLMCLGILERWLRGRTDDLKRNSKNPQLNSARQKSQRRRSLFKYRKNTIEAVLGLPALVLLPKAVCCSDTEDDGKGGFTSIDLGWRSSKYRKFLHMVDDFSRHRAKTRGSGRMVARRLDSTRTPSGRINKHAKACDGLSESCYSQSYLAQLSMTKKHLWSQKKRIASHLLDHYLSELEKLSKNNK